MYDRRAIPDHGDISPVGPNAGGAGGFKTLADKLGFIEGPALLDDGTILVVSMDKGLLYAVSEDGAEVAAIVGGGPNGTTLGASGEIFIAQNGDSTPIVPRVPGLTGGVQTIRPEAASEVSWLTRDPVSANDLCLGPDGCLYVTDPTWRPELDDGRIWRVDPQSGEAELLGSVPWYPNGIGFGPDDALYVASTGEREILRVALDGARLGRSEVVVRLQRGMPDGFAFDADSHIIIAAFSADDEDRSGSIQVWDLDGKQVEILEPVSDRHVTNVALSGHTLVACASSSGRLLAYIDWPSEGLPLHPFRVR